MRNEIKDKNNNAPGEISGALTTLLDPNCNEYAPVCQPVSHTGWLAGSPLDPTADTTSFMVSMPVSPRSSLPMASMSASVTCRECLDVRVRGH